jgi:hypothetical protein
VNGFERVWFVVGVTLFVVGALLMGAVIVFAGR